MIINLWSLCAHQRAIPDPTAASGERWFVLHVRLAVDMPLALPRVTQPTADLPTPRATSNIVRLANSRRMTPSQRRVTDTVDRPVRPGLKFVPTVHCLICTICIALMPTTCSPWLVVEFCEEHAKPKVGSLGAPILVATIQSDLAVRDPFPGSGSQEQTVKSSVE